MKLYKCIYDFIENDDDILVFYAENEQATREKIAEIRSKDEDFRSELFNDDERYIEALKRFIDIDDVAKKVYFDVHINNWTIEELEVPLGYEVYMALRKEIDSEDDVKVFILDDDSEDIEDKIYNELALITSVDWEFKKYISNNTINASLLEKFYCDEKDFMWDYDSEYEEPRKDIVKKYKGDVKNAAKYVEEKMIENLHTYLGDFADEYINHLKNGDEDNPLLSEDFYIFVAKKMLVQNDWATYEVMKVEKI